MQVQIQNEYRPSKKGELFHSSSAKYKILVGGYGSGKTRMAVEEVNQLALEHPGLVILVMRKTMPACRMTTMNEFESIIHLDYGKWDKRNDAFLYINGSKILFRGLDEPSKFKSANVAIVLFDEADEFTDADFQILNSRMRQMQREIGKPAYPLHFILILNPVDDTHWIYKKFVTNVSAFDSVGGVLELHSSTYDNKENLPDGYIEQLMSTMSVEEQNRYIHGNWGRINKGVGVFSDVFRRELHIKRWDSTRIYSLHRSWDFGFNHPACAITIKDAYGRKNIRKEIMGEKEHLDSFAPRVTEECKRMFGTSIFFTDFCDPRGHDKSDKGQTSVEILNEFGIYPTGERGMKAYVDPGIKCIRHELSTLIRGEPLLTVDPDCPILITAFTGAYAYDNNGEVIKDGYYDHLIDAYRYDAYQDKSNDAVREAMAKKAANQNKRQRNVHTGY